MSQSETKQLTCPDGHRFDVEDSDEAPTTVSCPECGADVRAKPDGAASTGSGGRGRSLWAVMGQGDNAATDQEANEKPTPAADSPDASSTPDKDAPDKPSTQPPPEPPSFLRKNVKREDESAAKEPDVESPTDSRSSDADLQAEPTQEVSDGAESDKASGESASSRPRGLWAMMGAPAAATDETDEGESESEVAAAPASASDEAVVTGDAQAGAAVDEEVAPESGDDEEQDLDDGLDEDLEGDPDDEEWSLTDEDEEDGWEVDDPQADLDDLESLLPPPEPSPIEGPPPGQRKGIAALAAGIAAALLAGLTILPWFWVKFPSTVAGVAALVFGYQSLGERRRARDRKPPIAVFGGMILGLAGMFAGPAFLNDLGRDMRERASAAAVQANLVTIGEALNRYHAEHGRFPAGGEWEELDEVETPMHGWMTALLPYLEQSELVGAIDRTKSWNDPVNFPAMSRPVPAFLVPDVQHVPNGQGYATTHYSGVGGEILTEQGRVRVGIFGRDLHVTRFDITDGLSQTMVAGEINRAFPAWGNPGNWRQTGRGLNQEVAGFGNADGTGAHFLMADGSVRFMPNRTSPEVLDRLGTLDSDDNAALDPAE